MVDVKSIRFPLDNTVSVVSKKSLVADIFKVHLPIVLLHLIRMRGVGWK